MKKIVIIIATLLCAAGCENATTFHASCSEAEKGYTCLNDGVYLCEEQGNDLYVWQKTNIKCEDICNENENSTKCGERDKLYLCEKYDDYEFYIWKHQESTCSDVCQKLDIDGCGTLGDSPTGYTCHDNKLIPCSNDVSCKSGGICGDCQNGKTECDGNKIRKCNNGEWSPFVECDSGTTCQNHECIPVEHECSTNNACGQGKICIGGKCTEIQVEPKCSTDADCVDGQICQDGECQQNSMGCTFGEKKCTDKKKFHCDENGNWKEGGTCNNGQKCENGECKLDCNLGNILCGDTPQKCDDNGWVNIASEEMNLLNKNMYSFICKRCRDQEVYSCLTEHNGEKLVYKCKNNNEYKVDQATSKTKRCPPCLNNEENEITCIQDNPTSVCIGQESYDFYTSDPKIKCNSIFGSEPDKPKTDKFITADKPEARCYEYLDQYSNIHYYYINENTTSAPLGKYEIKIKYCPYGCDSQGCFPCPIGTYRCQNNITPQMCSKTDKKWMDQENINLLVFEAKNIGIPDIWELVLTNVCYSGGSDETESSNCTLQESETGTLTQFMNNNKNTVLFTGSCDLSINTKYTIYINGLFENCANESCSRESVRLSRSSNSITLHAN